MSAHTKKEEPTVTETDTPDTGTNAPASETEAASLDVNTVIDRIRADVDMAPGPDTAAPLAMDPETDTVETTADYSNLIPAQEPPVETDGSDPDDRPACRMCGCTNEQACEGGCYWVEFDLCSTCADKADARDTLADRDEKLYAMIDGILNTDAPAITVTISNGTADDRTTLRRELVDTQLRLIHALQPAGEIADLVDRARELVKAL